MIDINPHRKVARIVAFVCYVLAGFVLVAGVLFTLAAATFDMSQFGQPGATNRKMAILTASIFLIIAVMLTLLGWRIQVLFGQQFRQDKLLAKSSVGCLRLGGLGCGLWTLPSASIILLTGKRAFTNESANFTDIFVGASGSILLMIIMLSVAWFISVNYTQPGPEDRKRAFAAYHEDIKLRLLRLSEPDARAYVQERTMEVLTKLDAPLKSLLLRFLSDSELLAGYTRVVLRGTDFRQVDLCSTSLPRADLHEINLEQSMLRGAFLFEANLYKANLRDADLSYANLGEANLRQADLTGAVLEKANLQGADLTGANVTLMQLDKAHLEKTTLPDGTIRN
ncbi:MAG TPA: pentapeptide repeat-containing protein [Blastocatellia bacterium]|nr:pentapeptide repeat-containing protein [Blastocatellia bacterium]